MAHTNEAEEVLTPVAPSVPLFAGPIVALQQIIEQKFLVWTLVQRTLRNRYRSAGLGYIWMVLEPTLLAATYWFLFVMLAGNSDELYPIWVLIGVIVWGCFGKSLTGSVSSLSSQSQMIHMAYFPRIVFPVSTTLGHIVSALGSALVLIPVILVFNTPITHHLLWVPVGIVLAGILGGSIGTLFAPLNCQRRDVEHLSRFIVRAGFFFSPIMWTAEMAMSRGRMGEAALWNPMTTPITMVRHAVSGKALELPIGSIQFFVVFFLLMLVLGTMIFMKFERKAVKFL